MSYIDEQLEKCTTIEDLISLAHKINDSIGAVEANVANSECEIEVAQLHYNSNVDTLNQLKQGKIDVMKKLQQYLGLKAFI